MKRGQYLRQGGFWNFVIPAAIGYFGSKDANDTSAGIAREQMAFNAAQAETNRNFSADQARIARDWSADMANTSYQRAVGDLAKAGLNPMLAYSQGGAPTPGAAVASGSAAQYSSLPPVMNKALAALSMVQSAATVENLFKTGSNIEADTALKHAQAQRETSSAGQIDATKEKIITADIPLARKQILQVEADTLNKYAEHARIEALTLLSKMDQMLRSGQLDQVEAQTALTKVDVQLRKLEVPQAEAYAEKFRGEFGKDVSPYLKEIVDILRVLIYGGRSR